MFQVKDICKSYHHRQILRDISFFLPQGQCLGVIGENGSGKSTLLGILAQVISADSGDILFQGRSVMGDRHFLRSCIGYVPQGSDLLPGLTGAQQLKLWQSACGCPEPIAPDVYRMLGLEELMHIKIKEMSGGMQRRISIAMALSTNPGILIMDEATAGLDASYREALLEWLEDFLCRDGSIIFCSHLPEEIARLSGTVLSL